MWRHVNPGDKVTFQRPLENAKRDAANAEQQRQTGEHASTPQRDDEKDVVKIQNLAEVDLERGDIVALGDPVIEPGDSLDSWYHQPLFKGELPLWQPQWKHPGRIGICVEPIGQDRVGRVAVSGCVQARVKVRDINHEYADVNWTTGGIRLTSTDGGSACVQILSIETSDAPAGQCGVGSDEKWAYVRIQNGGQFTLVGRTVDRVGPLLCVTGGSGGGNCPPKGKVQVYWLNPSTECLQAVLDRQGNQIYVCGYNLECRPIFANEWIRLHCDRWATWWLVPQQPVFSTLRAVDCIRPGQTTGTARVQRRSRSGGYEDDPGYSAAVTVDNTDCLVFALPGERFPARRDGCCDTTWIPTGTYGLTRRVRIDTCIPCGSSGTATVLQSLCGSGSGGAGCDKQDADCSTITACNTSGRPLAPCGPEEAVAQLTPGVKESGTDCCWYLQAGPFPTRATATLTAAVCQGATATLSNVSFPTFCGTWSKPTTAASPYLPGCAGAQVELAPKFTDCTCTWEIVQIKPQIVAALMADVRVQCQSTTCTLDRQIYRQVALWSCDTTACSDEAEWEPRTTGQKVDLVSTIECSSGEGCTNVTRTRITGCVFCASSGTTQTLFSGRTITYAEDFSTNTGGGSGGSCGVTANRKSACVLTCGGSPSSATSVPVVSGVWVAPLTDLTDGGNCLSGLATPICVLAVGAAASVPLICHANCDDTGSGGSGGGGGGGGGETVTCDTTPTLTATAVQLEPGHVQVEMTPGSAPTNATSLHVVVRDALGVVYFDMASLPPDTPKESPNWYQGTDVTGKSYTATWYWLNASGNVICSAATTATVS